MSPVPLSPENTSLPQLSLVYDRSLNYAFQQNAIPVIKELVLRNDGTPRQDLQISITTEPQFAQATQIHIQSLEPHAEIRIAPIDLKLSHDYLEKLNEKVSGWLKVEVTGPAEEDAANGELPVLCSSTQPVSLLARNEWCGLMALPEILAAFVLPNDPAIMRILGRAAEILREATGTSLNAYQSKSRRRAWEQVAAIYKAIAELKIRYITPPASFEHTGQKIRFPSDIVAQRFGTCLDLALLVATCCEQAGLNPLILIHHGHAYAGCWLEERTLAESAIDDLQHVRKLAAAEALTVLEATLLTSDSPGTLADAELLARPHLETKEPFLLALDIRRARIARIHPLPISNELPKPVETKESLPPPLPGNSLGVRDFDEHLPTPEPTQPKTATRIDQWKSRLLDLSLRNRLLNFREIKATVRILSAAPSSVEDELAASRELSLRPVPKLMGKSDPRDAGVYAQQQLVDPLVDHLKTELSQGRLHTNLEDAEHSRRLTELYRAARNSMEENGANTLFAAVGFLEWRETEQSERVLRAPLLLVPVELKRKSVAEGFYLRRIDEDTRLNVTLIEMLRQFFQKEIGGLDPLPEDENGVNVSRVFQIFRDAVSDLKGWEVRDEIWLGQFAFTKFLLWKDLSDRLDALTKNRIVRHLVHEAGTPYTNPGNDIRPQDLDDQYHPKDIFCPKSADSSQLAAVLAAADGQDFVLEGPPGTGKSQTITNIIAHCLAHGKRILFVAEKRAALDVVHRRLREEGLDPFCLELHSNKTGKADVLAQFDRSLKFAETTKHTDWQLRTEELVKLRATLNAYTRALHHASPCGLSAWSCFDYLLPRQGLPFASLDFDREVLDVTAEALEKMQDATRLLQERAEPLYPLAGHPLTLLACREWSPSWSEQTLGAIRELKLLAEQATATTHELLQWLAFPRSSASKTDLAHLRTLASCLLTSEAVGPAFALTPWNQFAADLDSWIALTSERAELRKTLQGYDEAKLLALNLDDLSQRWQVAQQSSFLLKWLRSRSVRKLLGTARQDSLQPTSETVADCLRAALRLREINQAITSASSAAQPLLAGIWAKGEPDTATLDRVRQWGERLHTAMQGCASGDLKWLGALRRQLADLFTEGPAAYGESTATRKCLDQFVQSIDAIKGKLNHLATTAQLQLTLFAEATNYLGDIHIFAERAVEAWSQIREWCSWQKARHEGNELKLAAVIEHLEATEQPFEQIDLTGFFERSFRRDLLNARIEAEPTLREFFGREHATRITRFKELDEKVSSIAREIIRCRLAMAIPNEKNMPEIPKPELGLLNREIAKRMRHIPVRQLLSRIPTLLARLKPCVLMSPLSVAQYLEPSHEGFDIVIFDEASQIPVWDAVGAIARGKQLIVVGDPKQLPPTNFFATNGDSETEDTDVDDYKDLESVLDELMSNKLRHKRLKWHYRSKHEELITFSNRQYYDNELLTFPSSETTGRGLRFQYLQEARYDKGKSRTNRREAEALVKELVSRLRETTTVPRSFGVVTFSQAQQQLVENLLDEQRRQFPEIEVHFSEESPIESEPVFVKNLENVQGDERDVILFSVCYGPDETGKVSMNFGPLNRDGGERRLNVAVTRAKHEVVVFTGLRSDQIDLTKTRARGVRDLKTFLDFAERGPRALSAVNATAQTADVENEFQQMVANQLRDAGYEVHHQVGCSGYRIDLAIVDPAAPGKYLIGIECDGATYHGAATARDRDKLRQMVMESLGWKLHRIWSTDWWHNAPEELKKLVSVIENARKPTKAPAKS